jgi:hypothetical protein
METLKYIVDDKGKKSSVIVSVKRWRKLNDDYQKLLKKINVFNDIRDGMEEINRGKKSGTKLQSLNDFLDEIRS